MAIRQWFFLGLAEARRTVECQWKKIHSIVKFFCNSKHSVHILTLTQNFSDRGWMFRKRFRHRYLDKLTLGKSRLPQVSGCQRPDRPRGRNWPPHNPAARANLCRALRLRRLWRLPETGSDTDCSDSPVPAPRESLRRNKSESRKSCLKAKQSRWRTLSLPRASRWSRSPAPRQAWRAPTAGRASTVWRGAAAAASRTGRDIEF